VANDDTNTTDENSPVSGNVLANDTDVDVETLTVTNPATYIGAYGTLVLAANGSYTYTPGAAAALLNNGQTADDVFTYIASDGTASDARHSPSRSRASAASRTPSTTPPPPPRTSSVSGNVLTNDTDAENDPLTVTEPGHLRRHLWDADAGRQRQLYLCAQRRRGRARRGRDGAGRLQLHRLRRRSIGHGDAHRHRQRHQRRADDRRGRHRRTAR
jgi:VCBS repeat-containing protein